MKTKLLFTLFSVVIAMGLTKNVKAQTVPSYNANITLKDFGSYASNFYMAPSSTTGVPTFIYGYYYTCYDRPAVYKGYWVSGNVAYAKAQVNSNGTLYQFDYPLYFYDAWSGTYFYFIQ